MVGPAPAGRWGVDHDRFLTPQRPTPLELSPTDRGGYVSGFEAVFDPGVFNLPGVPLHRLDPLFRWLLHLGREALSAAGYARRPPPGAGFIVGNLSYPTYGLTTFAESVWLSGVSGGDAEAPAPAEDRFCSGFPVQIAARALGLSGSAFALDAACASSLYALKLACDELHDRRADLMLAAGVNRADSLFLHLGFSALRAISPSGRSRPFHRDADGLLPAEGGACVALRRLEDAKRDGDPILGVIRGIGVSNDGASGGFLVPAGEGQLRALAAAYESAGIDPARVSLLECHATGTPTGDTVEIATAARFFEGARDIPVGSLKSNLGHLITAAGLAGLVKVLLAMEKRTRPPTLHADSVIAAFDGTPLRPLTATEPWDTRHPLVAGVSAFGFGGNNAHVVIEEWVPCGRTGSRGRHGRIASQAGAYSPIPPVAVTGLGVVTGAGVGYEAFRERLFGDESGPTFVDSVVLPLDGLRFPPVDLRDALAQQTLVMQAVLQAVRDRPELPVERTGVLVGMGCDPEIARYALRWRSGKFGPDGGGLEPASCPPLSAAAVIGTMPNIPANRLNVQQNWKAFGLTVSSEELSGVTALRLAARALAAGEVDAVVVAAVEVIGDRVHQAAVERLFPAPPPPPGDAAVALVLRRPATRETDGAMPRVLIGFDAGADAADEPEVDAHLVTARFGHAHAASGMLQVLAAIASCESGARASPAGALPWLSRGGQRRISVCVDSFSGARDRLTVSASGSIRPWVPPAAVAVESRNRLDPCSNPLEGQVAFLFPGAAAAYPRMGREFLLAFPEVGQSLISRFPVLSRVAERVYRGTPLSDPFDQLAASTLLCQAHARFARDWLEIQPQAVLGLSSGETNGIFAMGVWDDMDEMFREIADSGMYGVHLTGQLRSAARAWGAEGERIDWRAYRVLADVAEVEAALADEPRASLTIINAPGDVVVAGDAAACGRLLERVGTHRAIPLNHDMVVHCPEVAPFADTWRRIHLRRTRTVEGIRLYTNATNRWYAADREAIADALTGQAISRIDFPRTVRQAWEDGVRVFVEMGPRDTLARSVRRILGDRPHLAVALDAPGPRPLAGLADSFERLHAAGVPLHLDRVRARLSTAPPPEPAGRSLTLRARLPPVALVNRARAPSAPVGPERMPAAPPVGDAPFLPPMAPLPAPTPPGPPARREDPSRVLAQPLRVDDGSTAAVLAEVARVHRDFIARQTASYRRYVAVQQSLAAGKAALPRPEPVGRPAPAAPQPPPPADRPPTDSAPSAPAPSGQAGQMQPKGPRFGRAELEVLAGGSVSSIWGEAFAEQEAYVRQVRLPMPPLLLVDRVLGIDAVPNSMGVGVIWTETDVQADAWYMHAGRMTPGATIESGQADLLLISWLGVDRLNRGERVYRLLGCELTFHGDMPAAGDTLRYEIRVTGHARIGEVRLFFFNYDCWIGDRLLLSVRDGQAGFFTDQELEESGGVLWDAAAETPKADARVDALPRPSRKRSFSRGDLDALERGDAFACFGPGFEVAAPHQRTPTAAAGRMRLLDEVPEWNPEGGPWRRGYLRATADIPTDAWFYSGHFKEDPCMPGTLMADAAVQALATYMAAAGFTIPCDGWRFEPVTDEPCRFICRGQVVPDRSHRLEYEVFVEEVIAGPEPVVYASLLCSADGLKVFHCPRFGLRLVPDWPLSTRPEAIPPGIEPHHLWPDSDVRGDYLAMIACAWGRPTDAFGAMCAELDGPHRPPRLPGPPLHLISRIESVDAPPGIVTVDGTAISEYHVEPEAWYVRDGRALTLPIVILMEIALQPCGWLASYTGIPLRSTEDLRFRNLDGTGVAHRRIGPDSGTIRTRVSLTRRSRFGATTIVGFDVTCEDAHGIVWEGSTAFGFFTTAALEAQTGLPVEAAVEQPAAPEVSGLPFAELPDRCPGGPPLPEGMLAMVDEIVAYWPRGGRCRLGRIVGRQTIDPYAWYFKAHFYQDPVQPGSLGVEALTQLLRAAVCLSGRTADIRDPIFETIPVGERLTWKYRGEVRPTSREVETELEITAIEGSADELTARGTGRVSVDGLPIYEVEGLTVRVVRGAS